MAAPRKKPTRKKTSLPADKLDQPGGEEESEALDAIINGPPAPDVPTTDGRCRKALAEVAELNPHSLIGSWFIRVQVEAYIEYGIWWGIVVGEPQPGNYLVQIEAGLGPAPGQLVFELADLMPDEEENSEYRFFDNEEAMRSAFVSLGKRRKEEDDG